MLLTTIGNYASKLQVNTSPDNSSNTSTAPHAPRAANQTTKDKVWPRREWQQAQRNNAKQRAKEYTDSKRRATTRDLKPGDLVLLQQKHP